MQVNKPTTEEQPAFQVVDRRPFANPEAVPSSEPAMEKPRYPSFVEELLARVSATERRFEEKKVEMHQEISKTKARLESDLERRVELEKQKMVLLFLDVLDNLERAITAAEREGGSNPLLDGVRMTAGLFQSKLRALGVERIETLRQPFNPNEAQAVTTLDVSVPELDGIVVDEMLRGYRMGDHILRPAHVRVGEFRGQATQPRNSGS
jgi:molecular chaperone GrpE